MVVISVLIHKLLVQNGKTFAEHLRAREQGEVVILLSLQFLAEEAPCLSKLDIEVIDRIGETIVVMRCRDAAARESESFKVVCESRARSEFVAVREQRGGVFPSNL